MPPPVRGDIGVDRFLSRGRVVAVQNHFARKSLFFRKSVPSFVRYLEDFGENRCDIERFFLPKTADSVRLLKAVFVIKGLGKGNLRASMGVKKVFPGRTKTPGSQRPI